MKTARALTGLLCLVLAGCPEGPKVEPPKPVVLVGLARLTTVQGAVSLERSPAAARPADIEDLFDGDLISTGPGARAVIKFKNGGELELSENSRFRVSGSDRTVNVDLKLGIISLIDGEDSVAVVAPGGRTRIGGQTQARLGRDKDGLTLELLVGEITQIDDDGGTVTAKAGQKLRFGVGAVSVVEEDDGTAPGTALPIEWTQVQGAAELKPKGAAKFKPAARGRQAVEPGTAFRLTGSARSRLEIPGVGLNVGGGTTGTVDRADQKGARREIEVTLGSGLLELQFVGDGAAGVVIPAGGVVARVRGTRKSQVRVVPTGQGSRLQVITGEVEVALGDGAPTRVRAGEVALVQKSGVSVSKAAPPALLLPTGKKVRVYSVGTLEVGLALPEAEAEVQVATDAAFKDVVLTGRAKDFITVREPSGTLYWQSLGDDGKPTASGHATFLHERAEDKGDQKSDVVPETASRTNVVFQEQVPALTFTWEKTEGAVKYRLVILKAGDAKPVLSRDAVGLKSTVESGVLAEGQYKWQAMALYASGAEIPTGKKYTDLFISYDNSNTALSIRGPLPNSRATAQTRAQGVAPLGTKLSVNGAPVSLDPKGRYDVAVGRSSPLIFRLVARDGSEDYWVRTTR